MLQVYWTSPGRNTPQKSSFTATCHPSRKLSKLDEPDIQDTHGEVRMNLYSKGSTASRTYIQQLCVNIGYSLEDIPEAMVHRDG